MNRLWKQFVFGNLLLALLLLAACGGEQPDPEPLVVTAGKPGTPTPKPTSTPIPLPSSTPVPDLPDPAEIQTLVGLQAWVVAAYQHGADPAEVLSQLTNACWVRRPAAYMPQPAPAGAALQPVDLTGDGVAEWLVTVATDGSGPLPCGGGESFSGPVGGVLWIVNSDGLLFTVGDDPIVQMDTAPLPISTADFSGDGIADLLTARSGCGAHTCYSTFSAISGHGGTLAHVFDLRGGIAPRVAAAAPLISFDYPPEPGESDFISVLSPAVVIEDETGDGVVDVILTGGGVNSAGAGIHRTYNEVWSWDGQALVLTDFTWNSGSYRHHALYDANFYFALGERSAALTEYLRVVYDDALRDDYAFISPPGSPELARATARQFAAFRLALLAFTSGDLERMAAWRDWLLVNYPVTHMAHAAVRLSDLAVQGSDPQSICAQITVELENSLDPVGVGVLDGNTGYANPRLGAADVCPVGVVAVDQVTPSAAVATYEAAPLTDRFALDALIIAVQAHDLATVLGYVEPALVPCTTDFGMGALPCAEGESDGTLVPALQTLGCDGGYQRDPDRYSDLVDSFLAQAAGIYAVYEKDSATVILLAAGDPQRGARLILEEGRIVGVDFGCELAPGELLARALPDGALLVVPPRARLSLRGLR